MTEIVLTSGSLYKNGIKFASITSVTNGVRTAQIEVTGDVNFLMKREESGSFRIFRNGMEVGKEFRGLKLDYEGQHYEVPRSELSMFPTGNINEIHIRSGQMTVGEVIRRNGSLIASSDFNSDVLIIYLAFLAPYTNPVMANYGGVMPIGRGPVPKNYRISSLILALASLAFLGLGSSGLITFINPGISLVLFAVLAVLSYVVRAFGRRKYMGMQSS